MNHLAHLRLAAPEGLARLGALIGDHVKGDLDGLFPPDVEVEARLHRRVDSLTDAHPFTRAAKRAFPEPLRRFAPIALDIHFDHLLLKHWENLSQDPFEAFEARSYGLMREGRALAPEPLRSMIPRMIEARFLRASVTMEGVERAVLRVAAHWRHGEKLAACAPWLRTLPAEIAEGYPAFFREIAAQIAAERAALQARIGKTGKLSAG